MNYLLPLEGVFPMHCSANVGEDGDVAMFFGLSGTGKTTLSADPGTPADRRRRARLGRQRRLQLRGRVLREGDRALGRGGARDLRTTRTFGTILENVVDRRAGRLDLDDESKTENTRGAYPLEQISNASPAKRAGHPTNVVFLTADAFASCRRSRGSRGTGDGTGSSRASPRGWPAPRSASRSRSRRSRRASAGRSCRSVRPSTQAARREVASTAPTSGS